MRQRTFEPLLGSGWMLDETSTSSDQEMIKRIAGSLPLKNGNAVCTVDTDAHLLARTPPPPWPTSASSANSLCFWTLLKATCKAFGSANMTKLLQSMGDQ